MTFHDFIQTYRTQCTQKRVSGTTSNGAQCRKEVTNHIQNVPSLLVHLCTAGQDLTLTDCLVSSLRLIGANFNDLMKQRTINISNINIATTRCCLLPPRVLSAVFRVFSMGNGSSCAASCVV